MLFLYFLFWITRLWKDKPDKGFLFKEKKLPRNERGNKKVIMKLSQERCSLLFFGLPQLGNFFKLFNDL
jgi:hypothetical protein